MQRKFARVRFSAARRSSRRRGRGVLLVVVSTVVAVLATVVGVGGFDRIVSSVSGAPAVSRVADRAVTEPGAGRQPAVSRPEPGPSNLLPAGKAGVGRPRAGTPIPGRYIVVLDDRPGQRGAGGIEAAARRLSKSVGGRLMSVYTTVLRGFSVKMSAAGAKKLARTAGVASVRQDVVVVATSTQPQAAWHLDRLDQPDLPLSGTYDYDTDASTVNVYVLDSGIRATHDEFGGRVTSGMPGVDDNDCGGHGTAVAGALAASTWGVAKAVKIHPVRILNCDGVGGATTGLDAIEWVTKNAVRPAVVNHSWIVPAAEDVDAALRNSIKAGITHVAGAGNSDADACGNSPARVPEAITVGATDRNDNRAGFSNYGRCLDLFAPGTDIKTPAYTSDTATVVSGGTSLSSPLVAGAAALYLSKHPSATPAQVSAALAGCARTGLIGNLGAGSPDRLLNARCLGSSLTITNPGRQRTVVGVPVRLPALRTSGSSDAGELRYRATGLPEGLDIDAVSGVISGTATTGGSTIASVSVTDGSASTFTSLSWDVILGYGTVTNGDKCLDNRGSGQTDGNPVQLQGCGQSWTARADGRIEWFDGTGKCVTVSDQASADGLLLVLASCAAAEKQVWSASKAGELRNPASGKCMTAPQSSWNVQLTLAACDGSADQQWKLPSGAFPGVVTVNNPGTQSTLKDSPVWVKASASTTDSTRTLSYSAEGLPGGLSLNARTGLISGTPKTSGSFLVTVQATDDAGAVGSATFRWQIADGAVIGLNGMCADRDQASGDANPAAQLYPCNNSDAQEWLVRSDGRLEILDRCLTPANDAAREGAKMVMGECGSASAQIWREQDNGTLRNPASGLCLTAPAASARSQLILAGCTGTGNQIWTLPVDSVPLRRPGHQDFPLAGEVKVETAKETPSGSYSARGLPAGLSIDAGTGTITGTPTTVGRGTAVVTATESSGARASAAFTWTVHHGPITGPEAKCAEHYYGGFEGRTALVVWHCNNGSNQLWTVGPNDALQVNDKCLSVDKNATAAGALIVAADCREAAGQVWRQQADGTIVNPASGRCLNAPTLTDATQFTLADCSTATGQQWRLPTTPVLKVTDPGNQRTPARAAVSLPIKATFTGDDTLRFTATGLPSGLRIDPGTGVISGTTTVVGATRVTVTVSAGTAATGSVSFDWVVYETRPTGVISNADGEWCADAGGAADKIQVWDCNLSPPQTWTVRADGRLSVLGTKCMAPLAAGAAVGTSIVAVTCEETDESQVWAAGEDKTLRNTAAGLCLRADQLSYTASFRLASCTDANSQVWKLPAS